MPQGLELGGSNKRMDRKGYLVNKVSKGGWRSLILPRKEMVDHAAAEEDGRCQHNTARGDDARGETRVRHKQKLGTYLEGRRRVCEGEGEGEGVLEGEGGWGALDVLTARQDGCAAGPMKEVESEAPKISRPLASLRDWPVQRDGEEGRS